MEGERVVLLPWMADRVEESRGSTEKGVLEEGRGKRINECGVEAPGGGGKRTAGIWDMLNKGGAW